MQELIDSLKDASRYLLQNGQTKQGLAVQACVTMLEDDSEDKPAPCRWIERWYGSGSDRGWWVWEADHGDRVAYCGEGLFAGRLCSLIVQKHNDALGVSVPRPEGSAPAPTDGSAE